MAYPYQFNPYQFQPQMPTYQPQMQSYQQPQQPAYQGGIIWGTYDEACAYPLAPNAAVTIWDRNQKVVYWKQSDAAGRQTMQTIDYTIRGEVKPDEKTTPELATKEDLAKVITAIGEIQAILKGGAENA